MKTNEYLISAAGGNATAIKTLNAPKSTKYYAQNGKLLGDKYQSRGAEQAGYLHLP